jgi:hypothetical protein
MSDAGAGAASTSAEPSMSVAKSLADVLARVAAASTRAARPSPVRRAALLRLAAQRAQAVSACAEARP